MKVHSRRALELLLVAITLALTSCGPRMENQPSVRPYSRQMPAMQPGSTPTTGRIQTLMLEGSVPINSPIPPGKENLANGRIYYGYYCLTCHGDKGDGNGHAGESYVPKPADLSSPRIAAMSDGELYRQMLTGIGHDPVMEETVLPDHRWPLVLYVRTFSHTK